MCPSLAVVGDPSEEHHREGLEPSLWRAGPPGFGCGGLVNPDLGQLRSKPESQWLQGRTPLLSKAWAKPGGGPLTWESVGSVTLGWTPGHTQRHHQLSWAAQ